MTTFDEMRTQADFYARGGTSLPKPNNTQAENEARLGVTGINPVTGQPWKATTGTLNLGSSIAQFEMVNAIISDAMRTGDGKPVINPITGQPYPGTGIPSLQAGYAEAEKKYSKILEEIDKYGIQIGQVWNDLSAEVKGILSQSAEKQRVDIEAGYGEAKGLLTKEIEDLTADYQKAMGYYDNLMKTGIADPQGRIRQVRNELETNFKTYLGDVMDMTARKGVQGQTMLSSMPKTQEAFFKSMVPIVSQQQELAYGAGERIAGSQAGLETWKSGQRGAITGQLAGLEQWKGGTLANIEAQRSAGEANLASTVAGGKVTGYQNILTGKTNVAENILSLDKQRAAIPTMGVSALLSTIKGFKAPSGTTATSTVDTRQSAIPGTGPSGEQPNTPQSGETYQQWVDRVQSERLATQNPAWLSFYGGKATPTNMATL